MTYILIDTSLSASGRAFLFEQPLQVISTDRHTHVNEALSQLEETVASGLCAAGFFSYELGYLLEPKLTPLFEQIQQNTTHHYPLLWFGIFEQPQELNLDETQKWLKGQLKNSTNQNYNLHDIQYDLEREAYYQSFSKAQEAISAGDIYQLNLTFKSHFQFSGNPVALYLDLKRKQQMAQGAFIQTDDFNILSASPELFLEIDDQIVVTSPMKGTAKRGLTYDQDQAIKSWLTHDEKSKAENLMIVDLMRNDLARISDIGSVEVTDLFKVETYPTLHQMISTVYAQLSKDVCLHDWLKALFPPGSITGAPKVRSMELIHTLEQGPRGIYTGTIGMLLPERITGPKVYFNVAIRTVTLWPDGTGEMGIGSGVVSDSNAKAEYDECLLKMRFLKEQTPDFDLFETLMFLPEQGYLYYKEHLNRLTKSAAYFDFAYDINQVEHILAAHAKDMTEPHRVKLILTKNGEASITAQAVAPPNPEKIMRYVISEKRMHTNNLFLYHKTTNRAFYDDEHKDATKKYACDEVIFLNERDEITEGSRTNIFIEQDDILLTPIVHCGLLAGTLRAALLSSGQAREAVLTINDLENPEKVYLGNSVRGLLKAQAVIPSLLKQRK